MPTTIDYPGYRRSEIDAGLHPVDNESGKGKETLVGLSAFDIPQTIHFEVCPDQQVRIVFKYSDHEPPEKTGFRLPNRPDIDVYLGQHTRKIIEIRIRNLEAFLRQFDARLGLEELGFTLHMESTKQERVFRQNATLINSLISQLPRSFWKTLG